MKLFTLAFLTVVMAAGCAHSADPIVSAHTTVTSGLPKDWKQFESQSGEVSVGLPHGWYGLDLGTKDPKLPSDPKLKEMEKEMRASLAGNAMVKLVAFHSLNPTSKFALNMNVIVLPSQGQDLDAIGAANVAQLKSMASGEVSLKKVTLPAGDAELIEYKRSVPSQDNVDFKTYMFVKNSNQYVVTFSIPPDEMSLMPEIELMAKTFAIK